MKKIRHKSNEKDGITLISLVVTIIVLLILAGISISMLSGDNSILGKATQAKENTEIAEEKEMIKMASMQALIEKKHGNITKTELAKELENINSSKPTSVDSDEELNPLIVTFKNSGRVYQVDSNGNVTYIGLEKDLKNTATITASPESNTAPQLVQYVDLKIETFLKLEDDEIFVHYAWTNDENKTPSNSDYATATCNVNSNKKRRSVTLTSEDTAEGNYYLWVQVVFNENTITKKYGPYTVKDHTTLVATNKESAADSEFLGNADIPRNKIRSVTIKNSFGTHGSDETIWDVSASKNGTYLAWSKAITDETDGTYYDVVIEGKGGVVANTNASYLFANIGRGLTNKEITITGLEYLDTGLTTSMSYMFVGCNKVKDLDVSKFNTRNVTSFACMFNGCTELTKLDLDNFDTRNLKNMYAMFWKCNNLKVLEMENFNTSNVTSIESMFRDCSSLEFIDVSKWDTSKVTTMQGVFNGCSGLKSLDVSKFNTNNVKDMFAMFGSCRELKSLDVTKFNTSNVKNIANMFSGCSGLTSLDVTKFNTSSVTNMSSMFNGCSGLTSLDVTKFDTSNVTNMSAMFRNCNNLTHIDVTKFDTSSVTNVSDMFNYCTNLSNLNVTKFNTSSVTNMSAMFRNCNNLAHIDVTKFNTSNVTNMAAMFGGCSELTSIDVSGFDTSLVTSMGNMFFNCNKLTSLNLTNFDTHNVNNMASMFYGCSQLSSLNINNFNTSNVTTMSDMFRDCKKITILDISNFDTNKVTDIKYMFNYCSSITKIYVGDNWNISNVTSSGSMFTSCNNLVGDIPFNSLYIDKTYASKTGGYMTYKSST